MNSLRTTIIGSSMAATEPFFTEPPKAIDMALAYNWYGEYKTWADSQKYIVEWLSAEKRKDEATLVKSMAQHEISWVCGWICRLQSRGSKVDESSVNYRDRWLKSLSPLK
jgi:hypothetical protein